MRVGPLNRKDLQIFRESKFVAGKNKHNYQFLFLEKMISELK
jgi:hypothetical protein